MDIGALGVYVCLFIALYFEVFLLISFFEKRPEKKTRTLPRRYPTVTVLVPCFDEERTIASTLKSLLSLSYPKDKLQILVVDDGSTDGTSAIAKKFASAHVQVAYLYKKNGGKYTALNLGIERSSSELIGCLDADSFVEKDALIEIVKKFEEEKDVVAVIPSMKVSRPHSVLELMQAVEYMFGIFMKKMYDNLGAIFVLPGPFSFYRRDVFAQIGLFRHAHNTEDTEIAFRMQMHGLKIANAHNALVSTKVPTTLRALIKQRVRWSQGFLQNANDYRHMLFNRRYGNFGMLVLPFGLVAFLAGIYAGLYAFYHVGSSIVRTASDYAVTGIPLEPSVPSVGFNWYYLDTGILVFVTAMTLAITVFAVVLGQQIAETKLKKRSFVWYFLFFGFIAPFWLVRAIWGAALARQSSWR